MASIQSLYQSPSLWRAQNQQPTNALTPIYAAVDKILEGAILLESDFKLLKEANLAFQNKTDALLKDSSNRQKISEYCVHLANIHVCIPKLQDAYDKLSNTQDTLMLRTTIQEVLSSFKAHQSLYLAVIMTTLPRAAKDLLKPFMNQALQLPSDGFGARIQALKFNIDRMLESLKIDPLGVNAVYSCIAIMLAEEFPKAQAYSDKVLSGLNHADHLASLILSFNDSTATQILRNFQVEKSTKQLSHLFLNT